MPDDIALGLKKVVEETIAELTKWPQKGDKYWFIAHDGNIIWDQYYNALEDEELKEIGNFFKTEEEAKNTLEYLKVLHELKELSDDDQEWNGDNSHWELDYNTIMDKITILPLRCNISGGAYYFKSKESAQAAVEKIGKNRLKKYYFGIKEV